MKTACGNNRQPNATLARVALRNVICGLIKKQKKQTNCEDEDYDFLVEIENTKDKPDNSNFATQG